MLAQSLKLGSAAVAAAFTLSLPLSAEAAVAWDNGAPDQTASWTSDVENNDQTEADDFSLTNGTAVTGFKWWGTYDDQRGGTADKIAADDFTIFVLDDSGDDPNNIVQQWNIGAPDSRSATGNTLPGGSGSLDEYAYEHTLASPVTLSAGDYWLVFRNNTAGDEDFWRWSTSTANASGTDAAGTSNDHFTSVNDIDGASWSEFSDQLAFQIIPEPSTAGLLALSALALIRRRRAA